MFQLPAHASELNPAGSVWPHLKRSPATLAKARHRGAGRAGEDPAQAHAVPARTSRGLAEGFLAGTRLDLTLLCNLRN